MEKLELDQSQTLKGLLTARAEALRHFIAAGTRDPDAQYPDVASSVHAMSDQSFAQLTAILSRLSLAKAAEALREVEAALDRVALGCYGVCEACRCRIGYGRLLVLPEARRCAYCQLRMDEHRGGRDRAPAR